MVLQTITNINVDFYDKKYILINAKQYDKNSRLLSVTCYNHGDIYPINAGEHSAYIRYKKSDNNSVFNFCDINNKGKILVNLTEQMLASDGICYADLVIVNKGSANVNTETGEIVEIDNTSILSTMTFCIDVSETAVENSEIESSYEFNGLNEALEKAEAEYTEVILTSKSWSVGNAGGIRENEDYDNAKYYCEQSLNSANNAATSANFAETYMNSAHASWQSAYGCEQNAEEHMNDAKSYMDDAETYMNDAKSYMNYAKSYADDANASSNGARGYAASAQESMINSFDSASRASISANNAYDYYLQTEAITNGLNGAFLPMGTIPYSELARLKESGVVAAGYLYNISDNFITDYTFKKGAGVEYEAGTNVYYTADGYWDCLAGATVTGIKGDNETNYRKGNVNITAENVGAVAIADIATIDEIKSYLGIE